jgi:5-methylcytosine-specific restriction endonuclease McrA
MAIPKLARPVKIQRRKFVTSTFRSKRQHSYGEQFVSKSKMIKRRDGFRCTGCGWKPPKKFRWLLHAHHIIPKSKGGRDTMINLQSKCAECHVKEHPKNKGLKLIMQKQIKLLKKLKKV